jgi:hypothetical protein
MTAKFCLRCDARVDGLAHPHNCPGPQPYDWDAADRSEF